MLRLLLDGDRSTLGSAPPWAAAGPDGRAFVRPAGTFVPIDLTGRRVR